MKTNRLSFSPPPIRAARLFQAVMILIVLLWSCPPSHAQGYGPGAIVVGDTLFHYSADMSAGTDGDVYNSGYPGAVRLIMSSDSVLYWYSVEGNVGDQIDGYDGTDFNTPQIAYAWRGGQTRAFGPPSVYVGGHIYFFSHTSTDGGDIYHAKPGGQTDVTLGSVKVGPFDDAERILAGYSIGGVAWGGFYSGESGFLSGAGMPLTAILALDAAGNIIGSPGGIVVSFPADPGTVTVESRTVNPIQATYRWRKADGTWCAKFTNLPVEIARVNTDNYGSSNLFMYSMYAGDLAVGGIDQGAFAWVSANLPLPAIRAVYLEGRPFDRHPALDYQDQDGRVNALYSSSEAGEGVSEEFWLRWSPGIAPAAWDGAVLYYRDEGGTVTSLEGAWDGGGDFSIEGKSFSLLPSKPRFGPARLSWDGRILTFDPQASFASGGDDVYRTTDGSHVVSIGHGAGTLQSGAVVFQHGTSVSGGFFNASTGRFLYNSFFVGNVQALSPTQNPTQDTIVQGGLDVYGNTFGFSTDPNDPNKPAFSWIHRSLVNGVNQLRWLTARREFEWTWEAPAPNGQYTEQPLMSLSSSPSRRLTLNAPLALNGNLAANGANHSITGGLTLTGTLTVTGPIQNVNGGIILTSTGAANALTVLNKSTPASSLVSLLRVLPDGTVLIRQSGDISMGEFSAGPQP